MLPQGGPPRMVDAPRGEGLSPSLTYTIGGITWLMLTLYVVILTRCVRC